MRPRTELLRTTALAVGLTLVAAGVVVGYAATQRSTPPPVAAVRSAAPTLPTRTPSVTVSARPSSSLRTYPAWPGARQPANPGVPVRLRVPALHIDAAPRPTGRRDDGRLDVPDSARTVVWWAYGSAPGEAQGNVVLAGHVSWQGRWGLFAKLTRLHRGARVYLDRADGRRVGYRVTSVTKVAKTRLDTLGVFATGGPPGVVLVTCGGRWDAARHSYDDNVIARAVPIS